MTCRGADQIMLMYVARSMNRWASTDMRLTISPTVEDFRAELVITRACGAEGKKVSVAGKSPEPSPPDPCGGRRQLKNGQATALFSSPNCLSAFPAHVSQHKVLALIKGPVCLSILSSSVWKGPQGLPNPGLYIL